MDESCDRPEHDFDRLEIWRCPQLGNPVSFKYCRIMNNRLPCSRIVSCWGGTIDVMACLRQCFSTEELKQAFGAPAKDRLTRIIETIDGIPAEPPEK